MNIGIVGQGFVGSAIREGLKQHYSVFTYDLDKNKCNSTHKEVCNKSEIIFVCVPTPMRLNGTCDTRILESAIQNIFEESNKNKSYPIVVIKSTVPPGTSKRINKKYSEMAVLFSPEFLTEANSFEDFKNQTRILIGSQENTREASIKVKNMFKRVFPPVYTDIEIVDSAEAEMCKYFTNCLLASKVTFANQMYEICKACNINYNSVVKLTLLDQRIGKSHLTVPGPDGDQGFGGHCFPKDLSAMIEFGCANNVDVSFLRHVELFNNKIRKNRDWEEMTGRAVSDD